jgi:hypothetical protein
MTRANIRQWHSYIGLFMGPSVLFFALTGAVQTFSLHEAHGSYHPPALIEKLSSVHKDQVFALGDHHPPPAEVDADKPAADSAAPAGAKDDDDKVAPSTWVLKGFFLVVGLGLAVSTVFGLWMGLTQTRQKRLASVLVVTGALIPVGLLIL